MTLATVEIFPLQFFLRIILYFVFVLRFSVVLEAHSWCKRRGWNSLLEKKKGLFLVSQSVGFTLYGNVAAFNSCCCCLFNILLHDGLILCSGRARPCCRVVSRSQPSRYVNSISHRMGLKWDQITYRAWYVLTVQTICVPSCLSRLTWGPFKLTLTCDWDHSNVSWYGAVYLCGVPRDFNSQVFQVTECFTYAIETEPKWTLISVTLFSWRCS